MTPSHNPNASPDLVGFCLCPLPAGQRRRGATGAFRQNLMIDASDFDNPAHRCLSCGSTYSAAAPRLEA